MPESSPPAAEPARPINPRLRKAVTLASLTCFAVGGAFVGADRLWPSRVLNEIGYFTICAPLLALARRRFRGHGGFDYLGSAPNLLQAVLLVNLIIVPTFVTALFAGVGIIGKGESAGTSVSMGLVIGAFVAACLSAFDLLAWLFGRLPSPASTS